MAVERTTRYALTDQGVLSSVLDSAHTTAVNLLMKFP
jgi:hypothetical protein